MVSRIKAGVSSIFALSLPPGEREPSKSNRDSFRCCLRKTIALKGVFVQHLLSLRFRHTDKRLIHEAPRSRIGRRDGGITRFPHDIFHADRMAQLDAGLLVPKVDVNLAAEQVAGF